MMKEYFPQVINLAGAVCVRDINEPSRFYALFKDPELKTWTDAMNKASWRMEQEEIEPEDYLLNIRTACDNKKRRAEFELVFYGYLLDETLLYFL